MQALHCPMEGGTELLGWKCMKDECAHCGVVLQKVGQCSFLQSDFATSWRKYIKVEYIGRDGKKKSKTVEELQRGVC